MNGKTVQHLSSHKQVLERRAIRTFCIRDEGEMKGLHSDWTLAGDMAKAQI